MKLAEQGQPHGKVWIVGAGPGDPDLLTLKALRVMQGADLILFDQLVSPAIRALFPVAVPAFHVGKVKGNHSIAQQDLNALLVKKAREGKQVCRLKGGDPFVFGRGAEELQALVQAGIEAEVVPGITSASGATTYSSIPLTHRGLAQGCTFVTGHAEKELDLNWQALARLDHTIVFYMGLSNAAMIRSNLLSHGMSEATPVALIEQGCRPEQREVLSDLAHMLVDIELHQVSAPALIVIGEVVRMAQLLKPQPAIDLANLADVCLTA